MPILVGPSSIQAPSLVIPEAEPTQMTWTSPGGRLTSLTDWQNFDEGVLVRPGVLGLLMPTFSFYSDTSPNFDGEVIRGVRAQPREITVPLHIWGADRSACIARLNRLIYDLNPQAGEGILTVIEPNGQARTIGAYYQAGLEGRDDDDEQGRTWLSAALVFRSQRPFWEGQELSRTWGVGASGNFFPFALPVTVRDSQIIGSITVRNEGNVLAYPVWTLTGPMSSFSATNTRTGASFTISRSFASGDSVVIDTRERIKSAILNGVTNLWENISITSELWPILPGDNVVTFSAPASSGVTRVTMAYRSRYLAAY